MDKDLENQFEKDLESTTASELMTPYVYTISVKAGFKDLLEIMHQKRISAVLVHVEDTDVYYIITQKDIIDFLDKQENEAIVYDKIFLADLMHGPVQMFTPETPLDTIIREMFKLGFKRLIIGVNNQPMGIITSTDILMWNTLYFKPGNPLIFAILHNKTGLILGEYTFQENIKSYLDEDLFGMAVGALKSISTMLEEVIGNSGNLRELQKDNYVILFEPRENITGVLFADAKSIRLRHLLHKITNIFVDKHLDYIHKLDEQKPLLRIDLSELAKEFEI